MSVKDIYIVYETTNLVNGKYYIGVHKVNSSNYSIYLGSGILLKQSIKKYGRCNFMREIIQTFNNKYDAYEYEKLIITDELINKSNCYNLNKGGNGFNDYNIHPNKGKNHSIKTRNIWSHQRKGKGNPMYGRKGKLNSKSKKWVINGKLFYSSREAGEYFNMSHVHIQKWCNPKHKYHTPLCYSF